MRACNTCVFFATMLHTCSYSKIQSQHGYRTLWVLACFPKFIFHNFHSPLSLYDSTILTFRVTKHVTFFPVRKPALKCLHMMLPLPRMFCPQVAGNFFSSRYQINTILYLGILNCAVPIPSYHFFHVALFVFIDIFYSVLRSSSFFSFN